MKYWEPAWQALLFALIKEKGKELEFIPYFGNRELDRLYKNGGIKAEPYRRKNIGSSTSALRTPGDFFLNTLYKCQFKTSVAGLLYDEKSVYSEQDDQGMTVFSEDVSHTEQLFPITLEYGLTDNLEIGLRLPLVNTTLKLHETIGGDMTSKMSGVGLGNIALLVNLSIPLKEDEDMFSLLIYGVWAAY